MQKHQGCFRLYEYKHMPLENAIAPVGYFKGIFRILHEKPSGAGSIGSGLDKNITFLSFFQLMCAVILFHPEYSFFHG